MNNDLMKDILIEERVRAERLYCPACGYYCLGNGGVGCIDKPTIVRAARKELKDYLEERTK
jgi:hypothetical protein